MPWPTTPDDELFDLIGREVERQNTTVQLTGCGNLTSPAVRDDQAEVAAVRDEVATLCSKFAPYPA
jgi:glycine/serine hydroxymethyltransferase